MGDAEYLGRLTGYLHKDSISIYPFDHPDFYGAPIRGVCNFDFAVEGKRIRGGVHAAVRQEAIRGGTYLPLPVGILSPDRAYTNGDE